MAQGALAQEKIKVKEPRIQPLIETVGGTIETHDECIDVEPLGEFFHDRHEGVEIERGLSVELLIKYENKLFVPTIIRRIYEYMDLYNTSDKEIVLAKFRQSLLVNSRIISYLCPKCC